MFGGLGSGFRGFLVSEVQFEGVRVLKGSGFQG